ncbi:predicted protein [Nematostella vectensis]|uniref:VWFA domain-containing protein n=1 Tax=Nematostella vectensis TaxID=45351 RepID=A7T2D1_NEMVE|nr:predicted protein [Nematostella vectensis]|eukprot:XP_001621983.1 predicted protein [Nematostella vectensis]
MVILVFVVDTSASMNQRTSLGTTLLDVAKNAVETFIKIRQRDQSSRNDRYMLVTLDEPPASIKAGWRENQAIFMNELRNLQATGLSKLGTALKESFDLLNLYRLHSGIDSYGMGRNPFFLDPAMVICITDGGRFSTQAEVEEELHLPMHSNLPGSELTKEPFRWDQRLFGLILRMAGCRGNSQAKPGMPASSVTTESAIGAMCEVTGGKCYKCSSSKSLNQALESVAQKVQFGIVVNFEKIGGPEAPPPPVMPSRIFFSQIICCRMIYVKTNPKLNTPVGFWPIPESFWPDPSLATLPSRDSHPSVYFSCVDTEPLVLDNLPFDKYELEPSPLTQYILERKSPSSCWQTFICNSGRRNGENSQLGAPFGYLKASSNLLTVNLFVMPYNYPTLFPLIDELVKVHKMKPVPRWKQAFEAYLDATPCYYAGVSFIMTPYCSSK